MFNINEVLDMAIKKDASNIHFIIENKPIIRIGRSLIFFDKAKVLEEEDMNEIYDYLVKGNIELDKIFQETKRLDTIHKYAGVCFRVNISLSNGVPIATLKILKNKLPSYELLGIPDIVRKMTYKQQGLILITGRANSGKTTTLNALINQINENQNKKILTLEEHIEYKHNSKKSLIVQKEVGPGLDTLSFCEGIKNSLREDCDILVVEEIKDKFTLNAAIEMAESGHLVIATLHAKSSAETIDRMINFYETREQARIKNALSSILKIVISQRLLQSTDEKLVLVPEVMVVDNVISSLIRKEKVNVSELEDVMQNSQEKGSIGLINSLAQMFVYGKITLEQAKSQIEEKDIENLSRAILQLKIKQDKI